MRRVVPQREYSAPVCRFVARKLTRELRCAAISFAQRSYPIGVVCEVSFQPCRLCQGGACEWGPLGKLVNSAAFELATVEIATGDRLVVAGRRAWMYQS